MPEVLSKYGKVTSVRGSVVDVRFAAGLPPINTVLRAGAEGGIAIEVRAQLDQRHVRGVALNPTEGLAKGDRVEDTGSPLTAPVGREILSRMFDVFGDPIDRGGELPAMRRRSVHASPPPISRRAVRSEIFETGIKMIDVLTPLEKGGRRGCSAAPGSGRPFCSPK